MRTVDKSLDDLVESIEDAQPFNMHCGRFHKSRTCLSDRHGDRRQSGAVECRSTKAQAVLAKHEQSLGHEDAD